MIAKFAIIRIRLYPAITVHQNIEIIITMNIIIQHILHA